MPALIRFLSLATIAIVASANFQMAQSLTLIPESDFCQNRHDGSTCCPSLTVCQVDILRLGCLHMPNRNLGLSEKRKIQWKHIH